MKKFSELQFSEKIQDGAWNGQILTLYIANKLCFFFKSKLKRKSLRYKIFCTSFEKNNVQFFKFQQNDVQIAHCTPLIRTLPGSTAIFKGLTGSTGRYSD